MSNVVEMQRKAQAIADQASAEDASAEKLKALRGGAAQVALISQYMAALVAEGREAQQLRNGRELAIFEHDFDRIALFVDALLEGNYRQTAARLADVAESGIRAWMKAADDGDPRYRTVAALIRAAEAVAESDTVRYIRAAGKDPRFWAAGMTWLERKSPDRWGRRSEESTTPRVIVQIGVRDSDVQVRVESAAPQLPPVIPALDEDR
jgi:hypothetical protein